MSAPPREYWAFLSYRHADNRDLGRQWATWLHQRIETYEVPTELVGTRNARGDEIPARIFPVFRDEDELPADADLASPIYRALDASACLVVLCSPRSAASTYVAGEIAYFKRIGKEERVLAALLDGEPNVSWDAGKQALGHSPASECFPAPLRHPVDAEGRIVEDVRVEPIAADFRLPDGSQGWTSPEAYRRQLLASGVGRRDADARVEGYGKRCEQAVLKVVAGILGVPLGELSARDKAYQLARERRRARVFRRVAVALGLLAVLAAGAGVLAWRARRAAEQARDREVVARQRAEDSEAATARALAASDFQQGTALVRDDRRVDVGIAHLARALRRAEDRAARIRLWTLLQERAFWIPAGAEGTGEPPPPPPSTTSRDEAWRSTFARVDREGVALAPGFVVRSPDGERVVVTTTMPDGGEDPAFRVFRADGTPDGPWLRPTYEGEMRVWDLGAPVFSPDGRYLAVVAKRWREPDTVEVFDLVTHRPVGSPVLAAGAGPTFQSAPFAAVRFLTPGTTGLAAEGPLLVAASSRGDATVHVVETEWDDLVPMARAAHADAVTLAVVDPAREWLLSASVDGEVRVTRLGYDEAVGSVVRVDGAVRALARTAADAFRVDLADGRRLTFRLLEPLDRREGSGPSAVPPPPAQWGWSKLDDEDPRTGPIVVEGAGGFRLARAPDGAVTVTRGEREVAQRTLDADLLYLGFAREGRGVVTTNARFVTEVWNSDLAVRRGRRLDEAALFTPRAVPEEMHTVDVDVDRGVAVTWSHHWDPPNLALYWRTVWDLASGAPLSDRVLFADDGLSDPQVFDARLDADAGAVLHLAFPKDRPVVVARLELEPPPSVRPWLADFAEAVGGATLDATGNPVPVEDRAARLQRLLPLRAALDAAR